MGRNRRVITYNLSDAYARDAFEQGLDHNEFDFDDDYARVTGLHSSKPGRRGPSQGQQHLQRRNMRAHQAPGFQQEELPPGVGGGDGDDGEDGGVVEDTPPDTPELKALFELFGSTHEEPLIRDVYRSAGGFDAALQILSDMTAEAEVAAQLKELLVEDEAEQEGGNTSAAAGSASRGVAEPEGPKTPFWDLIHDSMKDMILAHLSSRDLARVAWTCKDFASRARSGRINARSIVIPPGMKLSSVAGMVAGHPNARAVSLARWGARQLRDADFRALITAVATGSCRSWRLTRLEALCLKSWTAATDSQIVTLLDTCQHLKDLDLTDCSGISDAALGPISRYQRSVTTGGTATATNIESPAPALQATPIAALAPGAMATALAAPYSAGAGGSVTPGGSSRQSSFVSAAVQGGSLPAGISSAWGRPPLPTPGLSGSLTAASPIAAAACASPHTSAGGGVNVLNKGRAGTPTHSAFASRLSGGGAAGSSSSQGPISQSVAADGVLPRQQSSSGASPGASLGGRQRSRTCVIDDGQDTVVPTSLGAADDADFLDGISVDGASDAGNANEDVDISMLLDEEIAAREQEKEDAAAARAMATPPVHSKSYTRASSGYALDFNGPAGQSGVNNGYDSSASATPVSSSLNARYANSGYGMYGASPIAASPLYGSSPPTHRSMSVSPSTSAGVRGNTIGSLGKAIFSSKYSSSGKKLEGSFTPPPTILSPGSGAAHSTGAAAAAVAAGGLSGAMAAAALSSPGAATPSQGRGLEVVSLAGCSQISADGVKAFLAAPLVKQNLRALDVSRCIRVTRAALIIPPMSRLQLLKACSCQNLHEVNIQVPTSSCLQELWLGECRQMTKLNVVAHSLTLLHIAGCKQLFSLQLRCPRLTHLVANQCSRLSLLDSEELTVPSLEVLNLFGCRNMTNSSVLAVAAGCPKLTTVNLNGCIGLIGDLTLHDLPDLRALDITGCRSLTGLSAPSSNQLVSLEARACHSLASLTLPTLKLAMLDLTNCVSLRQALFPAMHVAATALMAEPDAQAVIQAWPQQHPCRQMVINQAAADALTTLTVSNVTATVVKSAGCESAPYATILAFKVLKAASKMPRPTIRRSTDDVEGPNDASS